MEETIEGSSKQRMAAFASKNISIFRSSPMSLIQLYIPTESAQTVVYELGELGIVQLIDSNPKVSAFQRTFTSEIRRLDEMERKVRFLTEQCEREDLLGDDKFIAGSTTNSDILVAHGQRPGPRELDEIEKHLTQFEQRIRQMTTNQTELEKRHAQLSEKQSVLEATSMFLGGSFDNTPANTPRIISPAKIIINDEENAVPFQDDSVETVMEFPNSDEKSGQLSTDKAMVGLEGMQGSSSVGFVAGTIGRQKMAAFQRVLWRAMRGNILVRSTDIAAPVGFDGSANPGELDKIRRSAFVAFVPGSQTLGRVKKICEALGCSLYTVDGQEDVRRITISETAAQIDDVYAVLFSTRQAKKAELARVADQLFPWMDLIYRQKRIYDAMNCFGFDAQSRRGFIAEGWCPTLEIDRLENGLKMAAERDGLLVAPVLTILSMPPTTSMMYSGGDDGDNHDNNDGASINGGGEQHHNNGGGSGDIVKARAIPPSHFYSTPLLQSFQELIDSYGVPSYGEINPTIFMIVSFPFLFAVMFGDVGHGLIMTLFAGWMVIFSKGLERKASEGEIFSMLFSGRFIILLMGVFSIFTGLIYNDIFSKTMSIFPSGFTFTNDGHGVRKSSTYVYPFGIDPVWVHSDNGLNFLNSYKMKQSILMGIVQMTFGLCLSASNMIYRRDVVGIWTTFIPQTLFMLSLFGYLCFLIVLKWLTATDTSLLNLFIGMVLRFGAVEGTPLFPGQRIVQTSLMALAILCIPWMLLAKPVYIILDKHRRQSRGRARIMGRGPVNSISEPSTPLTRKGSYVVDEESHKLPSTSKTIISEDSISISSTQKKAAAHAEEQSHGFGELMVHQFIHTIEFVLGAVSNTASYLRLWALSLAHAQLSDVLWTMVIEKTVASPIALIGGFLFWLGATIAILVLMEGMSAFLHALRLHWVEFNNKFYTGKGIKFEPFKF